MVVYITSRYNKVLATASTDLPEGATILSDKMTDDVSSGVKVYECTLEATDLILQYATAGNYMLVDGSLFTIITSEYNTYDKTVSLYCEDAGLDFINKTVGEVAKTSKTFAGWITATLGSSASSGWEYVYNVDKSAAKTLEYTSEASAITRLHDILDSYNAEMYFTYYIEGLDTVKRAINFVKRRGTKTGVNLYIDNQVKLVRREKSIEDLATVWKVYGKDKKPLNTLTGYSTATKTYAVGDKVGAYTLKHAYTVTGSEVRCTDAIKKWMSALDTDGRIVQIKYTEYSAAQSAINYALRQMEKIVDVSASYDAELIYLPEGLKCGDTVNILDAHDNILLQARILTMEHSYVTKDTNVKLGNYTELKGSKAELNADVVLQIYSLSITSSAGVIGHGSISTVLTVSVYLNGSVITDAAGLPAGHLVWYEDGVQIADSDPRITDYGFTFTTGTLTTGHTYKCVLED